MRTLFWSRGENCENLLASVMVVDGIDNTSSSRCKGISSICKGCGLPVSSVRNYNYNDDDYEYDDKINCCGLEYSTKAIICSDTVEMSNDEINKEG